MNDCFRINIAYFVQGVLTVQLHITYFDIKHNWEVVRNSSIADIHNANVQAIWQYEIKCVAFNVRWFAYSEWEKKGQREPENPWPAGLIHNKHEC